MPLMPPPDPADAPDQDFEAFWDEFLPQLGGGRVEHILGVDVVVPVDVPLYFDELESRMAESKAASDSPEAVALYKEMLAVLFGQNTFETWQKNGVTSMQMRVLTAWGMINARGKPITFREAGQLVLEALREEAEAAEGKPQGPNRATRRKTAAASSRTRASGTTGSRSKATSGGSTASRAKK
jgi:hypothetical protein